MSFSWAKRPEFKERSHQLDWINKPSMSAGGTDDLSSISTYSFPPELFHWWGEGGPSCGTSLSNSDGKETWELASPWKEHGV